MGSPEVILLLKLLGLCVTCTTATTTYCPLTDPTAPTNFSTDLSTVVYTAYDQAITFRCCANGFDNISWYRQDKVDKEWKSFPRGQTYINVLEDGQVLQLLHAKFDDSTSFRCNISKNGVYILSHTVRLYVQKCSTRPGPPFFSDPVPENQTITEFGGNVTFHCTAYFGCRKHSDISHVVWFGGEDNTKFQLVNNLTSRYSVTMTANDDATELGSTFTISSVRKEDVSRLFMCTIASMQGQKQKEVRIFKIDKPVIPNTALEIGKVAGIVVGSLVLLVTLGCIVRKLWGPQIQLFCYMRCPGCMKTIDEENFEYNAFIYTAEEDQQIAEEIKEYLTNAGYKIFLTTDVQGNQPKMPEYELQSQKSAIIIFLYSENLKLDSLASIFFWEFKERRRIIKVIEIGTAYHPNEVMEIAEQGHKRKITEELDAPEELEASRRDSVDGVEYVTNNSTDMKFWKHLPRMQFPSKKESARKHKNFWCSLQNSIPKFCRQKQQQKPKGKSSDDSKDHQRTLSGEPLLTPNSPGSALSNDNVFEFDDMQGQDTEAGNNNTAAVGIGHQPSLPHLRRSQAWKESEESLDVQSKPILAIADVHSSTDNNHLVYTLPMSNRPLTIVDQPESYPRNKETKPPTLYIPSQEEKEQVRQDTSRLHTADTATPDDVFVEETKMSNGGGSFNEQEFARGDNSMTHRPKLSRGDSSSLNRPMLSKADSELSSVQNSSFSSGFSDVAWENTENGGMRSPKIQNAIENGIIGTHIEEHENETASIKVGQNTAIENLHICKAVSETDRKRAVSPESGYGTSVSEPLTASCESSDQNKLTF